MFAEAGRRDLFKFNDWILLQQNFFGCFGIRLVSIVCHQAKGQDGDLKSIQK